MTDKKEIIIDGVDVSGCVLFENADNEMGCALTCCGGCKGKDCDYKQLQRKTAECEELNTKYTEVLNLAKQNADANEYCLRDLEEENAKLKTESEELKKTAITLSQGLSIHSKKLQIATEALKNLSFLDCRHCPKAKNRQCYSSDDCKDVYRSYAQQALNEIEEYCRQNRHSG